MASSQCCDNPPALNPAGGEGKVVDSFGGLKAYLAGSDESKAAVILISDIFDFLHGDPYTPNNAERPLPVWIKSHAPKKGFEEAKPVIAALKEKGVSYVGAAGYCWGEVKCPISILGAEIDHISPPELIKQFEQVLSANSGVAHFVKIFPGVAHGWSVRYSHDDVAAVESAEEAMGDTIDWFNKNLKRTLKLQL
ncbi:endo-1,3 [Panicum miliaceum]|uniref:Endo-1,3 n=1 Tax=Panicum miliaceum TaxID=4540 RepID=A0A3L6RE07_PANMI|nr:endo-1,3 [Panicum miliaceum]